MKFKGTKGKWKVKYNAMTTCVESGDKDICTLTSGLSEVNKSNAKLIAAAPELLKALIVLLDVCNLEDEHGRICIKTTEIESAKQAINLINIEL